MSQAELSRLYGNGAATVKQLAAAAMWRHGLFRSGTAPTNPILLNEGEPVPLARMNSKQLDAYRAWLYSHDGQVSFGEVFREIEESYRALLRQTKQATRERQKASE